MTAAMTVAMINERGGRSSVSGGDGGCNVRLGQSGGDGGCYVRLGQSSARE